MTKQLLQVLDTRDTFDKVSLVSGSMSVAPRLNGCFLIVASNLEKAANANVLRGEQLVQARSWHAYQRHRQPIYLEIRVVKGFRGNVTRAMRTRIGEKSPCQACWVVPTQPWLLAQVDFHLIEPVSKGPIAKVRLDVGDKSTVDQLLGNLVDTRLPRANDCAKHVLLADRRDDLIDELAHLDQGLPVARGNQLSRIVSVGNHVLRIEHFSVDAQLVIANDLEEPAEKVLVWFVQGVKGAKWITPRNIEINGQFQTIQIGQTKRILVGNTLDRHVGVKP